MLTAILHLPAAAAPLFTDVTATHLPQDSELHSLDIEYGDFDKDGDLDMLVASEGSNNRIWLNDGKGKFTESANALTKVNKDNEDAQVADFDKDGNLDLIIVSEDNETHQYYLGNGKGGFQDVSARLPTGGQANAVEAADVDKDGYLDVFIGNGTGNLGTAQDLLLINDRKGGFLNETSKRLPALMENTQDMKLGDLDGDGDLDLVIGNETPKNRLLINDGKGIFSDSAKNLPTPYEEETREVLLFDVDNDKDLDIVFCNLTCNACDKFTRNPQVRLLINDGKGRFTDETAARMPKNTFSSWDGGYLDMDADGDLDLILCAIDVPGFVSGAFRAYRNDGKGIFSDATSEVMPSTAVGKGWDVEVADLNDDGALDMALGGWGTQARLLLGTVRQPVSIRSKGIKSGRVRQNFSEPGAGQVVLFPSRPGTMALIRTLTQGQEGHDWVDSRGRTHALPQGLPLRP
ncbi:MAG: VCBS repeat-containing protein [Fibrobacterota bacterium]|nr:VCBS repeat-containing protein [Fibrobacterota bacterium]